LPSTSATHAPLAAEAYLPLIATTPAVPLIATTLAVPPMATTPAQPFTAAAPVGASGTPLGSAPRLCVGITSSQPSVGSGQAAQWTVTAWTRGGSVPDAVIWLVASPGTVSPIFSFGCGSFDGSASCDLGAMDDTSVARQLTAEVTVPYSAVAVTSVDLTVTGSAAGLTADPTAAATISITAPPPGTVPTPTTTISPLPVGTLPSIPAATPSLSPGGNAGNLFPSVGLTNGKKANTSAVANVSALPGGASVVGAQLAGLVSLAIAFILAVTRLSVRRRPDPSPAEWPDDAKAAEDSDEMSSEVSEKAPAE
jgi:hypothetical protein